MSKHDDRRRVEAGPSLSTVVSRADADKLGSSERLDLVSVGAAGKIQIVRVTQAMYDTIPPDGSVFWNREFANIVPNLGTQTFTSLGSVTVPVGRVLDISGVRFVMAMIEGLPTDISVPLPDYAFLRSGAKLMHVRIDGTEVLDVGREIVTVPLRAGVTVLNQNWCTWWEDVPIHLITGPNQVVSFEVSDEVSLLANPALTFAAVAFVSGRWISQPLFDEIIASNRIS